MTEMQFLPKLKEFLAENGHIYTVRKYKMVEKDVWVDGVGLCHRIPLGRVLSSEALIDYFVGSGFDTVEDWWKKIKSFVPSGELYLYKVEVKEDERDPS